MGKSPLLQQPQNAPAPSGEAAPLPAGAGEQQRFQSKPDDTPIPEGIPEKFLRDGKPDYTALVTSYKELETKKIEDVKAEYEKERSTKRPADPDKYELPEVQGVNKDELAANPQLQWFRKQAHAMGYTQDEFKGAVTEYLEANRPKGIDVDAELKKLGDNATARVSAAQAWVDSFPDKEQDLLIGLSASAEGIMLIEKLMGGGKPIVVDESAPPAPKLTEEKLRAMQKDPRYYDPLKRDPAFVKEIEDGWASLFPKR